MEDDNSKKIQEYIESLYFSNKNSINSSEKYLVAFSIDKDGVVDVQMDWPDSLNDTSMLESIATLLFSINSGDMRSLIAQGLQNSGADDLQIAPAINYIIEMWLEFEKSSQSQPCVKPRNTLKKGS